MPRNKLTLESIKNQIEKYGLFIQDENNINLHGYNTKLRIYDAQLNKVRTVSYKTIHTWIKNNRRAEFDYN